MHEEQHPAVAVFSGCPESVEAPTLFVYVKYIKASESFLINKNIYIILGKHGDINLI